MQAPLIVFDHIRKTVALIPTGKQDKRLAEILASQREQVATSGRPPHAA